MQVALARSKLDRADGDRLVGLLEPDGDRLVLLVLAAEVGEHVDLDGHGAQEPRGPAESGPMSSGPKESTSSTGFAPPANVGSTSP